MDAFRQRRHSIDDVLAAVENQQHASLAEKGQKGSGSGVRADGRSQCRRDEVLHERGIAQRAQINEMNGPLDLSENATGNRHRDGRFSDAARADDREETLGHQFPETLRTVSSRPTIRVSVGGSSAALLGGGDPAAGFVPVEWVRTATKQ